MSVHRIAPNNRRDVLAAKPKVLETLAHLTCKPLLAERAWKRQCDNLARFIFAGTEGRNAA
jgi:hypothetical protein